MPVALIGRIRQCGPGIICIIAMSACGAAEQPAAVSSSPPTPQAATNAVAPPAAAPAMLSVAPTAIPTARATQPPTAQSKETGMPDREPTQPIAASPAPAAPVEIAKADLARRRAIAPDTIQVIEVRNVTWPDRGLGCPQPGMAYNQVQVDGQLIRLESGGQIFEYHSGGSKPPFLCEQPSGGEEPTPASGGESR